MSNYDRDDMATDPRIHHARDVENRRANAREVTRPAAECGATFAEFKFDAAGELADLYICDADRGHVGPHTDRVARKAWGTFRACDPPEEDQ